MKHKRIFAAAMMVAAVAVCSSAQAAQPGFYIGVQYGQASKETKIRDFDVYAVQTVYKEFNDFTATSNQSSIDDSDSSYGFFAGYRFSTHFAVEGSFVNLGAVKYRARATGNIDGVPSNATFNFDSETAGIAVSALGILPLSYQWEVYGRAGALFGGNRVDQYYSDVSTERRGPYSETSIDALAGVGTSLRFLEIYDLRLEYQRVFDAGDKSTGEGNVDLISVGVTVSF